ncbi:MAG: BrnT family toxin [Anaerolineae bacterium]
MDIVDLTWLPQVLDKLAAKHALGPYEVEQVFLNGPRYRFTQRGAREGEHVYAAYGRTDGGRYLVIFFVYKSDGLALIISARDMDPSERRRYERK